ncbi:MAG: DUF362 domain-containing protein [Candidatus Micrarchaeia archaeon]|nr:DUF362 domain-containing protein [Candidatus Aenigmarchaeota archaeon]
MSDVVFVKLKSVTKEGVREAVHRAMDMGEWKKYIYGNKIFVKINGISDQLVPGQCTSPWVIDAVLEKLCKEYSNADIYMGDANLAAAQQLNRAARLWGFYDLAAKYGVKFVNLSEDRLVEVDVNGKIFKKLTLPKILVDADSILNIPVAKTHCLTMLTCSLKNHWGMVPRFRHQYHPVADQCIADINSYFKKTRFNVVDATVCMEGNAPRTGIPKICNAIFASADRVALDYIVGTFMGYDASKIAHIERSEEMGVGSRKNIKVIGDKLEIHDFKKPEPEKQPIFKYEMMFRKSFLKPLIFDTPIFRIFADIATFYNTKIWYNKYGKQYIREMLQTPYAAEFKPLMEKNNVKV